MTKIFCDIADLNLIKKFNKKRIVKGFTTNPSLMRKAGAKNYLEYSKKIIKITASFGNCTDNQKSSLNLIIAQADEALYKAKNGGRNKVCSANQPIHSIPAKIWPTVSAK